MAELREGFGVRQSSGYGNGRLLELSRGLLGPTSPGPRAVGAWKPGIGGRYLLVCVDVRLRQLRFLQFARPLLRAAETALRGRPHHSSGVGRACPKAKRLVHDPAV